jgi:hypothetical protein
VAFLEIANALRWMNSGPLTGSLWYWGFFVILPNANRKQVYITADNALHEAKIKGKKRTVINNKMD